MATHLLDSTPFRAVFGRGRTRRRFAAMAAVLALCALAALTAPAPADAALPFNVTHTRAAPQTTIDVAPQASTPSTTANLSFSANELDATFECSLDGAPLSGCSSPQLYTGLAAGPHTFAVQATDAAGNVDPTPAEHAWTITEPPPPNTPVGTDVTVTLGSATLTFTEVTTAGVTTVDPQAGAPALPDGYLQAGAVYWDVDTTAAFSAPVTVCFSYDPLALAEPVRLLHYDGAAWTDVTVSADPVLGRVCGEASSFSVFAIATGTASVVPETSIHSGPLATTVSATAVFEFLSNDPLATFECALETDPMSWGSCEAREVIENVLAGPHELLVRARNAAGNFDATPARHQWTVEPPDTTIDSGPDTTTKAVDASFSFSSNDSTAGFECNLDGERTPDGALDWGSCESPTAYTGLPIGQHELLVRARNSANTDPSPAAHRWTIEPLPDTTITSSPEDPTESRDATFTFTSDQPNVTFECAFDDAVASGSFSPCESGVTYAGLVLGEHDFAVRARDAEGNVDPTPADWSWEIGTIPPPTTIESGPAARTESRSATFVFTAGRGFAYECRLDSGTFSPCASPKTYNGLTMGVHVFEVRVFDPEAVVEPEIARHTWEVADLTAPDTTIDFGPPATTLSRTANFAFGSNDPSATFECALDGAAFTACPQPAQYTNLLSGDHTLLVRAVDPWQNFDTSPAGHSWRVTADTTPPETTIHSKPEPSSPNTDAIFGFSSSEGGSAFECSLDGAPFTSCSAPEEYTDLTVGEHTFRVRATDIELNVDPTPASYTWTVEPDTTPPDTEILSGPPASTPDNFASFTLRASEPDATFECALDGDAFEECLSPAQYLDLLPSEHTLQVRAVDLADPPNADPTPAGWTWTVEGDTTGPDTTIQTGPAATTTNLIATFTFFANDAEADFECQLDGGAWESCSSPEEYSDLLPGDHVLLVRATDRAGSLEPEPASYSWTIIGPPETTIDSGPEGEVASASASFTFSASKPGSTFECRIDFGTFTACSSPKTYNNLSDGDHAFEVRAIGSNGLRDETPALLEWTTAVPPTTTINFGPGAVSSSTSANFGFSANEFSATFECSLDGAAFAECLSPHQVTGLAAGPHAFRVQAVDIDGNVDPTPAEYQWTVDLAPPQTTIDSLTGGSIVFSFSASEPGSTFECKLDGAAFAACTSPQRYTDVAEGSHTFQVRAIDPAGNADASPASHDWTVDTTAPQTTIGSGSPSATTSSTSATFNFTASEPGSTFECSLDSAAFAACSSPKEYTGLAVGAHDFRIRAADALGNVDATPTSYSWTVEPPPNCGGQVTASVNADSWIDRGSSSTNKGSDSILKVMSKGPSHDLRGLVRFQMPSMPAGCTVQTAKLRLYAGSFKDGRTLEALRVAGLWAEGGVNWDNQPATSGVGATVASGSGYREWDVKAQVKAGYDAGAHHGFLIRDAAEGADAEQQFHSREKGDNPPQLVLTFAPANTASAETTIDSGPSATTVSRSARFTFSSDQQDATFECSLDAAAFTACGSPKDYTGLAVGNHQMRVRARDWAGNVDSTPASFNWTIAPDTAAPETTIGSGAPPANTTSTSATFSFSSDEQEATFECSLDGAAYASCASPKQYTGVATGTHSFRVRAKDPSANLDQSPASHFWTVHAPPAPTCSASSVTAAADRDTWVLQSSPTSNYGNDSALKVDSKSGNGNARALVRFALPTIPAGCQVTSATLRLYAASYKEERTLQAFRLGGTFIEGGVNWGSQPATAGAGASAPSRSSAGYVEWSVTSHVQAMYLGTNTGFQIRDASENGPGMDQSFNSREKGADNPPQLIVETADAAQAPAPAADLPPTLAPALAPAADPAPPSAPAAAPAESCTLYASPTGSSTASGSSPTAATTVHAAAGRTVPGSVVCLLAGTYEVASEVYVSRSGEAGKPIVFRAEGGQALLRWTGSGPPAGQSYAVFKLASGAHHVEFAGLTIDGANRASQGVMCNRGAHHLVVRDSTIRNTGSAGVATKECDYVTVVRNLIHHTGYDRNVGWSSGVSINSHRWSDTAPGFHSYVVGNVISGASDESSYSTDGSGVIIDLGGNAPPVLVANNVAMENGDHCIQALDVANVWVVNNTCYKNGLDNRQSGTGEITLNRAGAANVRVINNVAYAWTGRRPFQQVNGATGIYSRNVEYGGNTSSVPSAVLGDPQQLRRSSELFVAPPFVDPSAPLQQATALPPWDLGGRLVPQNGATLIDAATNPLTAPGVTPDLRAGMERHLTRDVAGQARPRGAGWDVGAYEAG
jgi:hypothetical protein